MSFRRCSTTVRSGNPRGARRAQTARVPPAHALFVLPVKQLFLALGLAVVPGHGRQPISNVMDARRSDQRDDCSDHRDLLMIISCSRPQSNGAPGEPHWASREQLQVALVAMKGALGRLHQCGACIAAVRRVRAPLALRSRYTTWPRCLCVLAALLEHTPALLRYRSPALTPLTGSPPPPPPPAVDLCVHPVCWCALNAYLRKLF
jgi:hypothetical protein